MKGISLLTFALGLGLALSGCTDDRVPKLEAELQTKEERIAELEQKLDSVKSEVENVRNEFDGLRGEIETFSDQRTNWTTVVGDVESQASGVDSAISSLESEVDD